MNKTLKLTLVKPLILEAVKNETFQRGQIDKTEQKLITAAYHEQAGDEPFHERILQRGLYYAVADLKVQLLAFIAAPQDGEAELVTSEEIEDTIVISVPVTERFNQSYADPLAKLASEYVENLMLYDWWRPINEKQAAIYSVYGERILSSIKKCFNKMPPAAPQTPYPTYISLSNNIFRIMPGESCTITYATSACKTDDIEIRIADPRVVRYEMHTAGGFIITGWQPGFTQATLYSYHNSTVAANVTIIVSEEDE